jgi:hypothetical protein
LQAASVDPVVLLQPLTARVMHGGARARCLLLDSLTATIHQVSR